MNNTYQDYARFVPEAVFAIRAQAWWSYGYYMRRWDEPRAEQLEAVRQAQDYLEDIDSLFCPVI